ncbi:MAG: tRNA (N6-threonylcarbamoyladenosine(37)-N6)-methyltransferase TrmO [Synergistales bacterium]|nr:tRNA (N6-threonylcarbamoyladenosine(37)-N6)-methyltransferase TrmO [Synergistales bacterium]
MNGFPLYPVGRVASPMTVPAHPDAFQDVEAAIEVAPELAQALEGLAPEEEVLILFWFHRSSGFSVKVHPRGDRDRPMRGVFSTCAPMRPNNIGVTRCRITAVEEGLLRVRGLDAIDGTPVLDIKPARHLGGGAKERETPA